MSLPIKVNFPLLTLSTNLLGAILIGIIIGLSTNNRVLSENQLLFWKVGICGGFTTFSTFSLEALQLLENGKFLPFSIYVVSSVFLCILGVIFGRYISGMFVY